MMNKLYLFALGVLFVGFQQCKAPKNDANNEKDVAHYSAVINAETLKEKLYELASDEFEGRDTGEPGQKKAAEYLKDFYKEHDIKSAIDTSYFQHIPSSYFDDKFKDTENVIAMVKGSEFPEEYVVVSAHYDHLGVDDEGNIYNGADDDGSGTTAVMEMAKAFKEAEKDGNGPRRSVLFLHFTGEEKGLLGSKFYTENPVFSLDKTVANLNIDMIGRIDDDHQDDSDYVYVIGSNRLSSELDSVLNKQNDAYTQMNLDYKYNAEDDPNRFYYRSDHYNFAKHDIPVVFFFNGVHEDYHKPGDTPDKIEYELMAKRAQLVFNTTWEVANRDEPLKVDKK